LLALPGALALAAGWHRRAEGEAGRSAKCCSGICQGKKPKKGKQDRSTCVALDASIWAANADSSISDVTVACNPRNPNCFCVLTTGNAGVCGQFTGGPDGHCRVRAKNTDCQAGFGTGVAYLGLGRVCTAIGAATGGTACVRPCA
jgi:hypothetical protein